MRYIDTAFCDYSDDNKDMFEKIYYDADDRNYMNHSTDSEDLNFHQNLVWSEELLSASSSDDGYTSLPVVHKNNPGRRLSKRNTISSGIGSAFREVKRRTDYQTQSCLWEGQITSFAPRNIYKTKYSQSVTSSESDCCPEHVKQERFGKLTNYPRKNSHQDHFLSKSFEDHKEPILSKSAYNFPAKNSFTTRSYNSLPRHGARYVATGGVRSLIQTFELQASKQVPPNQPRGTKLSTSLSFVDKISQENNLAIYRNETNKYAKEQHGNDSLVKKCVIKNHLQISRSATNIPMQRVPIGRENNLSHTSSSSESETDLNRRKSGQSLAYLRRSNPQRLFTKKHSHDYAYSGYALSTASSLNSSLMRGTSPHGRALSFSTLYIPPLITTPPTSNPLPSPRPRYPSWQSVSSSHCQYKQLDPIQKHADVNAWLTNSSLHASTETLSPGSDASSTTIHGSDLSTDDEQQFEDECIRKMSLTSNQVDDKHMDKLMQQISGQEREFEDLFEKMNYRFPFTTYPNHSSVYVQEGTTIVKNMFGLVNLRKEFQVLPESQNRTSMLPEFTFLGSYKKALTMNLRSRLNLLKSKHSSLEENQAHNENTFQQLESSLKLVCSVQEHDKLLLHVVEVKNLCFLLVGLSCRLVRIEHIFASMDWRGVEERGDLERKREALERRIEEGKILKEKIERRSERVASYFDHYFGEEQRTRFERYLRCRVKICIEMREVVEMIRIAEIVEDFVKKICEHHC